MIPIEALDRPIAFHRIFAQIAGCPCAGLFLSQAWYWSNRTQSEDGWFWKTSDQWQEETVLTKKQQLTARKKLESLGLLEVELRGLPAKNYYRIDTKKLESLINQKMGRSEQLDDTKGSNLESRSEQLDDTKGSNILYTENTYIDYTENTFPPLSPNEDAEPSEQKKEILNFESRFTNPKKEPWRVGSGINDFEIGFVRWLSAQWKQETTSNAKAFLRKAVRNADKYDDALGYWEDFSSEKAQRNGSEIDQRLKDLRAYYNIPTFFKTEARAAEEMSMEEKLRLLKACEERLYAA